MSEGPLSPLSLNVDLHTSERTAAAAAAFLNETSSTSSTDGISMDANYNAHDAGDVGVDLQYTAGAPQLPVKLPVISSSSSESEPELDGDRQQQATNAGGPNGAAAGGGAEGPPGRSTSPPPNCAICLGRCKNKCFTDSCMHQFCFKCLCEWSKVKPECPLCKQTFNSIIHNVKSDNQFEEYHVQPPTVQIPQRPIMEYRNHLPYIVDGVVVNSYSEWNSWRITGAEVLETYRRMYPRVSHSDSHPPEDGANNTSHTEFMRMFPDGISLGNQSQLWRRYVYERKLYSLPVCDVTGRYRESSARFYRDNPAQMHRLMPWINRDIVCLLRNTTHDVSHVLAHINEALTIMNILSPSFRRRLQPYLGSKTTHFIHELKNFARSPYDMIGYDRAVQYSRQTSEEIVIEFTSSASSEEDNTGNPELAASGLRRSQRSNSLADYRVQSRAVSSSEQSNAPPMVNLLAFTISTTSEGDEAPGVTVAVSGGRGSQSTAINLTTHNRTNEVIINLDEMEATADESNSGSGSGSGSGGGGGGALASRTSSGDGVNRDDATTSHGASGMAGATPTVDNIELNSSSSDDCEFVLERKPPHLRTPEMVSLNSDSDSDVVFVEELKPTTLHDATFTTSDDEDIGGGREAASAEGPRHITRRAVAAATAVKNEAERYNTGASTSKGLRASGRRDTVDPVRPERPCTRRVQRFRRGVRTANKSKRRRGAQASSSSEYSSCDSSSANERDGVECARDARVADDDDDDDEEDEQRIERVYDFLQHNNPRKRNAKGKRVTPAAVVAAAAAATPPKRNKRKAGQKKPRKAATSNDASCPPPAAAASTSATTSTSASRKKRCAPAAKRHHMNDSESESNPDDEDSQCLNALKKRLRSEQTPSSPPPLQPQTEPGVVASGGNENDSAGAAVTNGGGGSGSGGTSGGNGLNCAMYREARRRALARATKHRSSESLNLTNALRKIQNSLRKSRKFSHTSCLRTKRLHSAGDCDGATVSTAASASVGDGDSGGGVGVGVGGNGGPSTVFSVASDILSSDDSNWSSHALKTELDSVSTVSKPSTASSATSSKSSTADSTSTTSSSCSASSGSSPSSSRSCSTTADDEDDHDHDGGDGDGDGDGTGTGNGNGGVDSDTNEGTAPTATTPWTSRTPTPAALTARLDGGSNEPAATAQSATSPATAALSAEALESGTRSTATATASTNSSRNINFYNLNVTMEEVLNTAVDLPALDFPTVVDATRTTTTTPPTTAAATTAVAQRLSNGAAGPVGAGDDDIEDSVATAFGETARALNEAATTLAKFGHDLRMRAPRAAYPEVANDNNNENNDGEEEEQEDDEQEQELDDEQEQELEEIEQEDVEEDEADMDADADQEGNDSYEEDAYDAEDADDVEVEVDAEEVEIEIEVGVDVDVEADDDDGDGDGEAEVEAELEGEGEAEGDFDEHDLDDEEIEEADLDDYDDSDV